MTLQEVLTPLDGVTVFEQVLAKAANEKVSSYNVLAQQQPSFQVTKRGKPFTKMASNKSQMRMTRENYFKMTESQGLQQIRDHAMSIQEQAEQVMKSPSGLTNLGVAMNKQHSDNFVSICISPNEEEGSNSRSTHHKGVFTRRHKSIDQVNNAHGAKKLVVDESIYSFKKEQKRSGSIQLNADQLAPLNDKKIMKAMLTQMGMPIKYSATPSQKLMNLTLNQESLLDITESGVNKARRDTFYNSRSALQHYELKNVNTATNSTFLTTKRPTLPELVDGSPRKDKFFFATRQVSESVGEMQDPILARKLKLNQIARKDDGKRNDSALAGLIYRNPVAT